ncbi:SDR family oxidoreductase [Umezawaea endophytica]|uniref:SDR family oxidoreductase n=1 Tax=Umezawaea endophytica TaxID=1654476 RepID=A0A9X2VI48_9PSEU|nr:SDR family oxidoreductase [Umezawaea endophytica]MCS7476937.1 SDR family oxidoreductase [Umezawaea endophytica]
MSPTSTTRVVVLGGTSGIGLAVAHLAAGTGARVVVGSRTAERASGGLPSGVTARPVDVTSPESLREFFDHVGEFDHLVYTAGDDLVRVAVADYDPDQARRFFDVRLFHALDGVRAALPTLSPSGSITLTSGAAAYHGGPGRLLGAAVSGAIISAARSLAIELAPVRVNVVAPGLVRTPLWSAMAEDDRRKMFEWAGKETLLGRIADPDDVAKAYLHLMDQAHTTGTVSLVDGGSRLA